MQEVEFSDLLIHVVDISSPVWELQLKEVELVLQQIGCGEIKRLTVFNKFDIADKLEVKKRKLSILIRYLFPQKQARIWSI